MGRADIVVHTPWASVEVRCSEVVVEAPFVSLRIPRRKAAQAATLPAMRLPAADVPPVPVAPPPQPTPPPGKERAAVVPASAPTIAEFAASFVAQAGAHEVVLLHPATGRPVNVRFLLPEGTLRKVHVHRYRLTFDYGRRDVALVFLRSGGVRVRY
jgi:hypothetical protein